MRIGLDVDEVLAQLHAPWIAEYNKLYGDTMSVHDITHWDIHELVKPECGKKIFDLLGAHLYDSDRIWPYPLARQAVTKLRDAGHSISFVTSCHAPADESAKLRWLLRHGFFKLGDTYIPGRDKSNAPVDVLVDDHIGNVEAFNGWAVLVTRPHNITFPTHRLRVNGVLDFTRYILK